MVEDKSFNAFLKMKLEEGLEVPGLCSAPGDPASGNGMGMSRVESRFAWRHLFLMAAALAILCGVSIWQVVRVHESRRERDLARVIELLEECQAMVDDGQRAEPNTHVTVAERLLAWQDAPFVEICNL